MMAAEKWREGTEEEGEGERGGRGPIGQEARWITSDSQCEITSQLLCSITESLTVGPDYSGIHCIWVLGTKGLFQKLSIYHTILMSFLI